METWLSFLIGTLVGGLLMWLARRVGIARGPRGAPAEKPDRPDDEPEAMELLLSQTPAALLLYSDDGVIRYSNGEARRLFAEGEDLRGENFLQLVGRSPEPLRRALLSNGEELLTLEVEGQAETYQLSKRAVRYRGEHHVLMMVNQLTREVSRREVEVLKKVIRVMSHELNNSLASISSLLGSARFISRNPRHADRLDEVLTTIEERSDHLKSFLSSYVEVAKMPRPQRREVRWTALVSRIGELFPKARVEVPPKEPGFFDQAQLEQVLINLLKNAHESGSAPEEVALRIERREDGGFDVRVLDRGSGFGPEAAQNALLPYYTTKPTGSGVGLALAREVAEAHGGSLSIRHREGGGAAVTCSLPPRDGTKGDSLRSGKLTLTSA